MEKNDLKREKRFQKHLEREFQVDAPPASYFQAVQDALDSLPDELPVKVRPLPQRVLRTCVALAACLVVAVGVATGINLVNPVLMESMPGVGQIFQDLNHREEQKPSPTPEVESSTPYEEEGLPDIPAFEPAAFPLENNLGLLTVRNASCDGSTLILELDLELWDSPLTSDSISVCDETSGEITGSFLSVEGHKVEPFPYPSNQSFTRQENGLYSSTWLYQLSEEVPHGTELSISMNIPRVYGWSNDSYQTLDCLLNADFLVTVDQSSSFRWEDSTTDNGVELSHVEATSEYVIAQLDIPFFGWLNSTLTMPFTTFTVEQNQIPLSCYFQLTTEDGTVLSASSSVPPGTTLLDYTGYKGDGSRSGALVFEAPPEGTSQLVLTLYEYPTALSGMFRWDHDPSALTCAPQKNRVTAEFTIDLEEGRVYASQNYAAQGRQKLDYRLSAGLDRAPAWENGYISGGTSDYSGPPTVFFYVQEEDYRPVELRFYRGDGLLISSYNSVAPDGGTVYEGYRALLGLGTYMDDRYGYGELPLDSASDAVAPLYGGAAKAIAFELYEIDSAVLDDPTNRFELVDSVTGEVLVSDVAYSYWQGIDSVYGTQTLSFLYPPSNGAWEDQEGTDASAESQINPSPIPEFH